MEETILSTLKYTRNTKIKAILLSEYFYRLYLQTWFYLLSALLGSGNIAVNRQKPCLQGAYIVVGATQQQTVKTIK